MPVRPERTGVTMRSDDRTVVLTGATSGIGRVAAAELADRGATVAAVGRDRARGEALEAAAAGAAGVVRFHRTDLATREAVRTLAADLRRSYDRIDVLAHNAGLSAGSRRETADGVELTLAVNHLAPYLLTHELLDHLRESPDPRVVVTASEVHRRTTLDPDDLQFDQGYDALAAYARSKAAVIAFTLELADRLPPDASVTANCVHPGFVPSTGLFRDARLRTRLAVRLVGLVPGGGTPPAAAADRLLTLTADERYGTASGRYVGGEGPMEPAADVTDPSVRERLWERSAALVGVSPDWP